MLFPATVVRRRHAGSPNRWRDIYGGTLDELTAAWREHLAPR
jgi:hypothetical protein